jgi:branched-chain amino acid transport system substrate-binding protein
LKRTAFIIIGVLLVLGLLLPACEGENVENTITVAVCGPFTDLQGINMWNGANMAADEINDAGGVTIAGTDYTVVVKKVETKEATEGESGTTGSTNLQAIIDNVDFCVGGFRTEVVTVYREVAMDAQKIFMNCGAATGSLQFSVVTDYAKYKYWFKATPYNESFLVGSLLKMTGTLGSILKGTLQTYEGLNSTYVKDDYKVSLAVDGKLRVAILMENAAWCAGMVTAANYYLPLLGYTVTDSITVSPTASDISSELSTIASHNPHIIFTAFSGSVGAVYSIQKGELGIPAVTIGINVPGQQLSHFANTAGSCEGEIMLDTWAVGLENTPLTADWFEDYVTAFGVYPVYTAGTYDAIRYVCEGIEATQSLDSDVLVAWMEDPANMMTDSVASEKVGTFPIPEISTNSTAFYLSEDQVATYYDLASYGKTYVQAQWGCGYLGGSQLPNIAHDLLYGPGYATGIGSQWQRADGGTGAGQKVGIWPMDLGVNPALVDQYGNWSFAYPGTTPYILTIGGMLNIPYDPY